MPRASVRFEGGDGEWVVERDSVGFVGTTDFGEVEFLITADALAELVDPTLDRIVSQTATEAFEEHEEDIHRIAFRELVKRLGGEPPILLTFGRRRRLAKKLSQAFWPCPGYRRPPGTDRHLLAACAVAPAPPRGCRELLLRNHGHEKT